MSDLGDVKTRYQVEFFHGTVAHADRLFASISVIGWILV